MRSKTDPLRALLQDQEDEPILALIVKVMPPTKNIELWQFNLLIDEAVEKLRYKSMTDFLKRWEIVDTNR